MGGRERSSGKIPRGWSFGSSSDDRKNPNREPRSGRVTQQELDDLLDKISREGINSLSEEEMKRLELAREQMRGEK